MPTLLGYGTTAYGTGSGATPVAPTETCVTVGYLMDRTFDLLLGAAREERNQLSETLDISQSTFAVTYPLGALKRGTYLAIDDEVMYVWSTDEGSESSITVQRGDKGTTPAVHAANSIIQVNPYFTRYQVRQTLQDEIRSWGPQIFQVQWVDVPLVNYIRGYDLGISGTWFYVLSVTESPDSLIAGPIDNSWPSVSYRIDQSADMSVFPSGSSITVTDPLGVFDSPRTLHVVYAAPIDVDSNFADDDCLHLSGMDESDYDIAPYGAAWRLASGREVRRMLTEAQGVNVDLQQFPPGYQLKAAEGFKQLRDSRIQDAIERLRAQYPIREDGMTTVGQNIDTLFDDPFWIGVPATPIPPTEPFSWNPGKGQNIDALLDDEFFTGSPSSSINDVPSVFQVSIGGHGYVIDPAGYSRVTVPLRRESTDESVEPGEQTLNTGGAWRRSQDNWFLGAGQEYLDNRFAFVSVYTHSGEDPSVRTRFWRSKGVDPWTEGSLSLLPEYGNALLSEGSPILCSMGGLLYAACNIAGTQELVAGDTMGFTDFITDPDATGWPTIESMTTDGYNLYIACGVNGIAILPTGETAATWMRQAGPTPVVTAKGSTGSTHYTYYVVGVDANGYKTLVSAGTTITNGNASLTTGNFNEITWAAVPGMVSYDVLKGTTSFTIGNTTADSFTDDGSHATVAYVPPTAATDWIAADFVVYANSFLLVAQGPQLVSVGSDGSTIEVMTHLNPNFLWNCGSGSPGNIYVGGNGGKQGEIYGVQLSTTNFTLAAPYIAGQLGDGEGINDLAYYEGLVILATSLGVRASQSSATNGFLTSGSVITDTGPATCLAIYGSFVYYGITDYVENDGIWQGETTTSGLGRLFLSEFSDALLPAYATDVMSTIQGTTCSVAMMDGVPWFAIENSGVWLPTGNQVPQGYLETGWVRYGTVEDKILVSMDVRHDPLHGTVEVEVVPFGQSSFLTAPSTEQGSIGPNMRVSAGNLVGEAYMVIPILTRDFDDPTKGPVLRRWTCRAIIVAARQDQIIVPIIWADEVLTPMGDGSPESMDLVSEWEYLKGLEQEGTAFIYQEGALSYLAFIDQIEMKPDKWNDQKQMLEGILSVKLLTVN